jgi:hypothetical protein
MYPTPTFQAPRVPVGEGGYLGGGGGPPTNKDPGRVPSRYLMPFITHMNTIAPIITVTPMIMLMSLAFFLINVVITS